MEFRNRLVAVLVGIGVLLLAIILQQLTVIPAILIDPDVAFDPEQASRIGVMLFLPLSFVGLGLAGVVYLYFTDRGWNWLDLRRPTKWDIVWMIGGTVLVLLSLIFVGVASQLVETEPPEQALMLLIREDLVLILFMIATVWILNAPIEEFLFRNIIQKRLYEAFSGVSAVVITSVLFALIHIFTFVLAGIAMIDVFFPILGIFLGSIIMGFAYWRTENLYVPIVIHGLYNSFQLVILLLAVVLEIDEVAASIILIVSGFV